MSVKVVMIVSHERNTRNEMEGLYQEDKVTMYCTVSQ